MADALYLAVTCVAIPLSGGLAAGWTANHAQDIAGSWADGCAQLTAWWTTCRRVLPPLVSAAVLWLLVHTLRAHGRHRAGVTA